jgi:hypothetical protein
MASHDILEEHHMGEDIHIEHLQAVNVHVGGQNNVIAGESGTFNNYVVPPTARAELQVMLDELLRVIAESTVRPAVRDSAEQARSEADAPRPRTARLRELMNAVVTGAGKVGVVVQTALNVLSFIDKFPR